MEIHTSISLIVELCEIAVECKFFLAQFTRFFTRFYVYI
jgi:hypothetical protein